ncbi:MAG: VWA domain-containing protein [Gemmatirosa sp.]
MTRTLPSLRDRTRRMRRTLARTIAHTLARVTTRTADDDAPVPDVVALEAVRRRLELLLAGLHGRAVRVDVLPPPARRGVTLRAITALARAVVPHQVPDHAARARLPRGDGATVRLPATITGDARLDAATRYRVLALVQAERLARDSAAHLPDADDPLACACYLIREGAATDRAVARRVRGALPALHALRAEALATRPPIDRLPPLVRDVEALLRESLHESALHLGLAVDAAQDGPDASRAWAIATSSRLRGRVAGVPNAVGRVSQHLFALPPVMHWGGAPARARDDAQAPQLSDHGADNLLNPRLTLPIKGTRARAAANDEASDRVARVPIPTRATDGAPGGRGANERQPDVAPDPAPGPTQSDAPMLDVPMHDLPTMRAAPPPEHAQAHAYPEWDANAGRHRARGATVLVEAAPDGDGSWADTALREHAALVRRVRQRFEPLRARRVRLPRQRQGDELDLAACVETLADRAAGRSGDERLYVAAQPARRPLAIALLVDVSGSTDTRVSAARDDARQIIDVEKEAVLLAGEALDALGDPFTVLTFSSRGAHQVRMHVVKSFAERHDATVRRRVSAMRPAGNTRLGAAVRHASTLLARQPAGHRLLLLLSDGRPNDMDGYHGRYAVEDARQAVHEARALGVFPFCLTVDREESEYVSHIFGAAGHTVLRRPDQLPLALVRAVRQLVGAGAR